MDEHNKQAYETQAQIVARIASEWARGVLPDFAPFIASALRSTAAAAVAAERERCKAIAVEYGADDAWHPERRNAAASIADAIAAAPIVPAAASPAQAERVNEHPCPDWWIGEKPCGVCDICETLAQPPAPSATAQLGMLLAEVGARLTITPELVGTNGDPDIARRVIDAHARGCRETSSRIAARLRARADEDEKTVADIRRDWLAHEDRPGDAARIERLEAIIGVLRSEADALEGT